MCSQEKLPVWLVFSQIHRREHSKPARRLESSTRPSTSQLRSQPRKPSKCWWEPAHKCGERCCLSTCGRTSVQKSMRTIRGRDVEHVATGSSRIWRARAGRILHCAEETRCKS